MPVLLGTDSAVIASAAAQLAAGELVAFATETVYGLGARADDDVAVARIFAAKGRPANHPLIVHVHSATQALAFADHITPAAQRLMDAFWPGPLTLILPRRADRGRAAAGGQDSVGLRVPAHPVALALLTAAARLGVAGVAAPSANRFGRVSPTTAAHVVQEFGPGLTVLDGGPCSVGIESAIVDCTRAQPALLRPGQLGLDVLQAALGADPQFQLVAADALSPRASGTACWTPSHCVTACWAGPQGRVGWSGYIPACCRRPIWGWQTSCFGQCPKTPLRWHMSCSRCCANWMTLVCRPFGSNSRHRTRHGTVCGTGCNALRHEGSHCPPRPRHNVSAISEHR
jgi:tRNA threonylcarbamoyl adenosine modification protein (Sua5/YciO/YrdC/YwlC family)